jgi:outer membrane protein
VFEGLLLQPEILAKMILSMIMKKMFVISLCLMVFTAGINAQDTLSLDEAKKLALENNFDLRNSLNDIETARYKVKETVATGFPQVDATINYMDNIGLPVQLVPGDFFGEPGKDIEVQFGTKYSSSAGASVNQLIFSGSYIVGLQAAKAFLEQSQKNYQKNRIDVVRSVSEAYFLVLATQETIEILDSTLAITQNLARQTEIIVANGFQEETDADQLNLLVSDLEISRNNAVDQLSIASSLLRFRLGMQDNQKLVLSENIDRMIELAAPESYISKPFDLNNNIDFRILKNQQDLAMLQVKLEKSAYLPNISAFLNYQTQAQRQAWDFFDTKGKWYSSSMLGVTMNIPLFSSGERYSKVKQAQFQFEKTKVAEEQVSTQLTLQYETIQSELKNALQTYHNTIKNRSVAEKIFKRTGIKYSEGIVGSLDYLNAHNQYLNAQSQYINASLNLLNKTASLESLLTSIYE